MDVVRIRKATPADNVLLAEFGARAFDESFGAANKPEDITAYLEKAFSPETQAAELAEASTVFLIAEVKGQTSGYAQLKESHPHPEVYGSRPVELVRIYAGQEWIGQGIGPALMQACLEEAKQGGYDTIWLGVWEHNPRAIRFYEKWGFTQTGTQAFQLGADLQTDWVMQKPLMPDP